MKGPEATRLLLAAREYCSGVSSEKMQSVMVNLKSEVLQGNCKKESGKSPY